MEEPSVNATVAVAAALDVELSAAAYVVDYRSTTGLGGPPSLRPWLPGLLLVSDVESWIWLKDASGVRKRSSACRVPQNVHLRWMRSGNY
jgi:hypothetical protein